MNDTQLLAGELRKALCAQRQSTRSKKYARSLGGRFPQLFQKLMQQEDVSVAAVAKTFTAGLNAEERDVKDVHWHNQGQDGFRNTAVNVCHILPIECWCAPLLTGPVTDITLFIASVAPASTICRKTSIQGWSFEFSTWKWVGGSRRVWSWCSIS